MQGPSVSESKECVLERLQAMGWGADLAAALASRNDANDLEPARVCAEHRGLYTVLCAGGELRAEISDCLETAPERQRLAFQLREGEGLSSGEICKILGVSVTNLGVMLHRLRNRMRECLEARGVIGKLSC